jgi:hypothetical protein
VPGYDILRELGRGGMGVVYQARHLGLNRLVALKMILAGGHAGPDELARFRGEAEAVARLKHANVVQVYDVGEAGGLPYFSLEFVEGGSLDKKLAGTPLPPTEAAALVETLARAIAAAHAAGLVHRDLKPANVLLTSDGTPKVTDFGLAKRLDTAGQTASGAVMGTPSYMAPEQAGGKSKETGPACDVYALGAILYECLTGRPPFKGPTPLDTIMQVVADEPVPPARLQSQTPRDLETICLKCLRKEPAKRYASAAALADDLRRFAEGRPIAARPVGRVERAAKWVRRNPVLAGMAAVVVLTLLAATGVSTWFGIDARQQAELAKKKEAEASAKGLELVSANETLTRTASALTAAMNAKDSAQAARAAADLAQAMKDTKVPGALQELAKGLSALAPRLESKDAAAVAVILARAMKDNTGQRVDGRVVDAHVAVILARAMKDTTDPYALQQLGQGLSALARRMEAKDAAPVATILARAMQDTTDPYALQELARGLSAVPAPRASKDTAAVAAEVAADLARAMKGTKNPVALLSRVQCLAALAPFMEAKDATAALVQAMMEDTDSNVLDELGRGLSAIAAHLEAKDAGPPAAILAQAMRDTKTAYTLLLPQLTGGLSAVAARLEAKDAGQPATILARAMKDTRDYNALQWQAKGLSALADHLEARDAEQPTAILAQALKDIQARKNITDPANSRPLARGLSAVARRLEAKDAATTLLLAMRDITDDLALQELAEGLSAVAPRLGAKDAAAVAARVEAGRAAMRGIFASRSLSRCLSALAPQMEAKDAVATLVRAMKSTATKNAWGFSEEWELGQQLPAAAARLEARDAAPVAVILTRAMKDTTDLTAWYWLARGLSAVAARMEPRDAAAVTAQAAALLMEKPSRAPSLSSQHLSALLSAVPPAAVPARSATAAAAVAFLAGAGQPLTALAPLLRAAELPPGRLSPQQLIDLLKLPACAGGYRRVVLDQLGNRYGRRFADQAELERFAKERKLDLDFTTPPRPEPTSVR